MSHSDDSSYVPPVIDAQAAQKILNGLRLGLARAAGDPTLVP